METLLKLVVSFFAWLFQRPSLRVRIQEDEAEREVGGLVFEVENVSDSATSLNPVIAASYLSIKHEPMTIVFDVREGDRSLAPFVAKQFSASAREKQAGRSHGWFRVYRFTPTRGRTCLVRIRNASLQPIGMMRFWFEKLAYKFRGETYGKESGSIDDYRARQRSKGPH